MAAAECVCCGTAAVISPIGSITQGESKIVFGEGGVGAITRELYNALSGIQTEIAPDPFGWLHSLDAELPLNLC